MKIQCTEKDGCALLRIVGAVTIENASACYDHILDSLNSSKGVILELSRITDCDAAALQIFYATRLAARSDGKFFKVLSPSKAAQSIAANAGFCSEHFQ